jgi:hypothetical protein
VKYIRRGWRTFSKFVRYEVDGGDQPLKISYPDLNSIARCKDVW